MSTGLIFDIKRYAINDGPGIRMTVFFKGCHLSCQWCHNPESISLKVQKMYNEKRCIGASTCLDNCPNDALTLTNEGIVTDFEACNLCGKCAEVCPTKAFEMLGEHIPLSELMRQIDTESIFFDKSGGGVTFSGGEPLLHHEYLLEALKECGKRMIHRTVDTTAHAKKETLLEVAKHTELFLVDIKLMDSKKHKEFVGLGNEKILENIVELSKTDCDILFRIPLIKGVNADDENIKRTAKFVKSLEGERTEIELLPYHNVAQNKYKKLGDDEGFIEFEKPSMETIFRLISILEKEGLRVKFNE